MSLVIYPGAGEGVFHIISLWQYKLYGIASWGTEELGGTLLSYWKYYFLIELRWFSLQAGNVLSDGLILIESGFSDMYNRARDQVRSFVVVRLRHWFVSV